MVASSADGRPPSLLVRGGLVLTMDDAWRVRQADVLIAGDRIAAIRDRDTGATDADPGPPIDRILDASGAIVLPGFVQTHLHLCQTLFRGLADDRPLLAWLRERVWPLEAAHRPASLRAATRLAAAELLAGGTTAVLTMETVHDTDAVFEALVDTGLRATVGKCLMDVRGEAPARLAEDAATAIDEAVALHRRWDGRADGRLRAALAPRFALSCSRALLEAVASVSAAGGLLVHTHASEQQEEVAVVRAATGLDNMAYFAATGLATARLRAAHCVWVTDAEQALMAERGVHVLHCPGSNLKLGSGIAPVVDLRARGIPVSLGADGAACSNALDMFHEMRLAATLQAMRAGPGALPARDVVRMATRGGAEALGLDGEIGQLSEGRKADVIIVAADELHQTPAADPYSILVYSARAADVRYTVVDGRVVAERGAPTWADGAEVAREARTAAAALVARAGL